MCRCVHGYKPPCAVLLLFSGGGDPKDASEMLNDPEMMKAMAMAEGPETQNQAIGPPKFTFKQWKNGPLVV